MPNPIDGSREEDGGENTTLAHSRFYWEWLRDAFAEYDTVFELVIEPPYYWDYLIKDTIWLQDLPQGFALNAVKRLLEVDEIDEQGNIPICALLYDVSKTKYMIYAPSAPSETSLFFTEFVVNGTINSVQDNSTENFAGDGTPCHTSCHIFGGLEDN